VPVSTSERPVALFLTRNLRTGGAERVFVNLVNNARTVTPNVALLDRHGGLLRALNPDVAVFARVDRTGTRSKASIIGEQIPGETFLRMVRECLWLRDTVLETRAAVVSSFLMRAHIVALFTKLLFLPRIPVVLNVHEHPSGSANYLYPFARDRAMMRWITRNLFRRADRIVVVAEDVKRDLVESFDIPAVMIDVAYNGIDLDAVRSGATRPSSFTPQGQTIVAVGRLVQLKGYDLLIRAIAELRKTRDVRLVLVGDGEYRGELERLVSELNLATAVTFAGWQDNPWSMLGRADALALTSRTEAFPCVLTEAMALGVPVLATNCSGGVEESLLGGEAGKLVPSGDVGAIARGLEELLSDQTLRAKYVEAGRRRAESFDLATAQRRYESVLGDVIAARAT
jgi:glycosyltransferase involved in cell wall biosynthesis